MSGTRVREARPARAEQKDKSVQRKQPEVGGSVPRVDLLPPEVHERRRTATVRSTVLLLAVLAAVVVGGGFAFASLLVVQTADSLASEQERTLDLLAQQGEFIEVRQIQSRVTASEAAERVGLSTEVDWAGVIRQLIAAQPAGVTVGSFDILSVTPTTPFAQPTVPLQAPRIASMDVALSSPTVPDVASLMDGISANVRGVVDVIHVETVEAEGVFTANLIIYFDKNVLVSAKEVTE